MAKLLEGTVHTMSLDMKKVLSKNDFLTEKWNSLTSLARDEWICWVTNVKKDETRRKHLDRLEQDLQKGKRRPCCWPGCPHRNENTKKWFKNR